MKRDEYFAFHRHMCDKMIDITAKKNADYTGDTDDPFANFTLVEKLGACSVTQGFITRMCDKLSRITSLTAGKRNAAVVDESVEDTLLDLANYCILMAGYMRGSFQDCRESSEVEVPLIGRER